MHHRKTALIHYEEIQVVFTMSFCKGIHNMKMEYLDKLILVVSVE